MPWQRKTVRKSQPVDVFIVGAAKAGTTALHTALDKHPLMFMSAVKEPNYFSAAELQLEETLNKSGLITTDAEYRKLFSGAAPQQLLGEASVSYLAYPSSAERIFAYNPDAKIIISLREPVSRAISHHAMEQRLGFCKLPLETIFHNEARHADFHRHYFQNGLYLERVSHFLEIFGKDQVLILLFDDLQKNPRELLQSLFSFIGISSSESVVYPGKDNAAKAVKNPMLARLYQQAWIRERLKSLLPETIRQRISSVVFDYSRDSGVNPDTLQAMHRYYQADVSAVASLLGIDLSGWRIDPNQ